MNLQDQKTYRRILGYIKPHWFVGLMGILGTVAYSGVDAGFVYFLEPILNEGFIARDQVFIEWLPFIIFAAFIGRGIASFISTYCMTYVARTIVMEFRDQLFKHYMQVPAKVFDRITSGQLLSKLLYDTEQVAQVSMDALTTFLQSLFLLIGLFVVMLRISIPLTLIYMATIPVIALSVILSNSRIRRTSRVVQESMMNVTDFAREGIEGYREIRMFGAKQYEESKFKSANIKTRQYDLKVTVTKSINVSGVQLVAACGIAIIIYLAINPNNFSMFTSLSAGEFTSIIAAMLAMLKPLKNVTSVNSQIQRGIAGAISIFEVLDSEVEENTGTIKLEPCKGKIEFKNVNFSYPQSSNNVLYDICFTVEPGTTVAIVGRSGSGKSTIASLIPRFYEISEGNIYIDNKDVKEVELASLRKNISIVSQHITLFNDTVFNNIAYSDIQNIDHTRVMQAATQAHVLEFAEQLPEGLNSQIGENGVMLSGGQRQRIAIARAIYKNSPILLLDEATSALDTESERYIQDILVEIMQTKTTIIIAHRLSTIERADSILVMDDGKIVEIGNHQDLIDKKGYYRQLYDMQFSD